MRLLSFHVPIIDVDRKKASSKVTTLTIYHNLQKIAVTSLLSNAHAPITNAFLIALVKYLSSRPSREM